MNPTQLRLRLSKILRTYGIDNLEFEIALTHSVREILGEKPEVNIVSAIAKFNDSYNAKEDIFNKIKAELGMNPSSDEGQMFVEFSFIRSTQYAESLSTFCNWWKENFPDPQYWSFKRMREFWPKAFSDHHVTVDDTESWKT